jgi:hypothetical protein
MLPEIWILLPELNEDVPDFGKSITAVYEKYLLLRSWLELGAGKDKTLRIPACISRSVDRVYGKYEYKISDALKKVMSDSKKKFEEKLRSHKAEAESKIIFSPNYGDNPFEFFNSNLEEDSNSESRTLKALTRLSAPSVSVVLLHESNGKLYLEPTYKTEVPNDVSKIDSELSGKMLQKVVNISHKTVAKELFDENNVISLHFDKEHAMFGNRTITLRNNTTIIGGCLVKYSPELGVIIKDLRT